MLRSILSSSSITAFDAGEENSWDSSYEEIGNYWGDFNGTGYYYIDGPAGSIDHYPNTFTCDCGVGNYTGGSNDCSTCPTSITGNTTGTDDIVEPLVLVISIGASAVIVIVVILIMRSGKSY